MWNFHSECQEKVKSIHFLGNFVLMSYSNSKLDGSEPKHGHLKKSAKI